MTPAGYFLSADWGTSSLRLRCVELQPLRILGEIRGDAGAASVEARAAAAGVDRAEVFAEILRSWIERLRSEAGERITPDVRDRLSSLPVVISGMASSSIGWRELPYATLPFPLDGRGLIAESLDLDEHAVHILSGVRGEVDVMRGEETEILGLLSDPGRAALREDALFILPGTHSKHARLERGAMVEFSTHLTGELLDLLRRNGILRHHVLPPPADVLDGRATAADGFRAGVAEGAAGPLTNVLFRVRARSVLERKERAWATAYLAGILIGAELAAARAAGGDLTPIVLSASRRHQEAYVLALEVLGLRGSTVLIEAAEGELAAVKGQALYLARKSEGVAT